MNDIKNPPSNIEAERAVLGSILLDTCLSIESLYSMMSRWQSRQASNTLENTSSETESPAWAMIFSAPMRPLAIIPSVSL